MNKQRQMHEVLQQLPEYHMVRKAIITALHEKTGLRTDSFEMDYQAARYLQDLFNKDNGEYKSNAVEIAIEAAEKL